MTESITIHVSDSADMTFDGRKIASVSSREPGRERWTELHLYDRGDGGYVFQRVGRSDVYHLVTCRKVFGRLDMEPADREQDITQDDFPCQECRPDEHDGDVVFERDKYSGVSCDDARKLLWAMQDRDRVTKQLRMSRLAQELLLVAAEGDHGIRDASREALTMRSS